MDANELPPAQTDLDAVRIVERAKTVRLLIVGILLLCGFAILAGTVISVVAVLSFPWDKMPPPN